MGKLFYKRSMNKKKSPPTIVDVAEKAGVSTATVSRLLNKGGPVSEQAKESIEKAIKTLDYTPQRKRKSLLQAPGSGPVSTARSRPPLAFVQLGLSPSSSHSQVANQLAQALQEAALAHGRTLVTHRVDDMSPSTDLTSLLGNAEGVILRTINDPDLTEEAVAWLKGWPTVKVLGGSTDDRIWADHISTDHSQAGILAAEYLMNKGCKQFIFLATTLAYDAINDRCLSYVRAIKKAGFPVHVVFQKEHSSSRELEKEYLEVACSYHVEANRAAWVKAFVDQYEGPTGLFVPTDLQYSMIMPQLQVLGLDIGNTLHAISCDRETRCLEDLDPMQATLDLHIQDIAIRAVRRLLFRIEHPNEPLARITVAPNVVQPEDVLNVKPPAILSSIS